MGFIAYPHLPQRPVTLCAVGGAHREVIGELNSRGIGVVPTRPYIALPLPVRDHADMLLHHGGGAEVWLADREDAALKKALEAHGFRLRYTKQGPKAGYPADIPLNCFPLGGALFGLEQGIAPELLNYYQIQGREVLPVKQGYAKCAACLVDARSLITADPSIARAAEAHKLEVLLIRPGHIRLDGHDTGFIGGCCGLLAPDLLAVVGDLGSHPDHTQIISFCLERGVQLTALCKDRSLSDVGGILPLLEYDA